LCAGVPIILVGTKADLRNDEGMLQQLAAKGQRVISLEESNQRAKEIGAVTYMEVCLRACCSLPCAHWTDSCAYFVLVPPVQCSALTQEGLKNVFDEAIRASMSKKTEKPAGCACTVL
jgi:GTPase SAR1 family protein